MTARVPDSVAIVGGGIIGLSTAYYLAREGVAVTVIERDRIGAGASHGNAGWITPVLSGPLPAPGMALVALRSLVRRDSPFHLAPSMLPTIAPWLWQFWRASSQARHAAGFRATAALAMQSVELWDALKQEGVEVTETVPGLVFACIHGEKADPLLDGLAPIEEFGYRLPATPSSGEYLRALEPALSDAIEAGFVVERERAVVPSTACAGLATAVRRLGGSILEGTEVSSIDARAHGAPTVRMRNGDVAADAVVLAAGAWTTRLARSVGCRLPMQAAKGYSLSVSPTVAPAHSLYLVEAKVGATPMEDRLRLAGTLELSGVNTRLDRRRLVAIARASAAYLAGWDAGSERDHWTGMRPLLVDGLPAIGPLPRVGAIYVATGHGMLGITLGPATGRALADEIVTGTPPDVLRPFRPDRFRSCWPRSGVTRRRGSS